ncbi:MAG: hypothetical protein GXX94_10370 [Chloroflexi bacterium]|nr:hypothetical protein [Chloroflexota bacterium]
MSNRLSSTGLARHRLRLVCAALILAQMLGLAGCRVSVSTQSVPVIIAAHPDPEQQLLAALTAGLLRDRGYPVIERVNLQSDWHVRQALTAGSVQIAWQDTGNVWFTYLGHDQPIANETSLYRSVKSEDYRHGVIWLTPLPWSTRQSILVRSDRAAEANLATISDLAQHISRVDPGWVLCAPTGSVSDLRGVAGLQRVYGFRISAGNIQEMEASETVQAVVEGQCDGTIGAAKDLALHDTPLVLLRDDRAFFSAAALAPTVHVSTINQYPELEHIIGRLTASLDYDTLARLERQAVSGDQSYARIAETFLKHVGLIE